VIVISSLGRNEVNPNNLPILDVEC
jgi:hypothetical protein